MIFKGSSWNYRCEENYGTQKMFSRMIEQLSSINWKWMMTRGSQAPEKWSKRWQNCLFVWTESGFGVRVNCSCSVSFLAVSGHIIHTRPVSRVQLDSWSSDRPKFEFPSRLSCLPLTDKHLFPFPSSSDPPSLIQHNWLERKIQT